MRWNGIYLYTDITTVSELFFKYESDVGKYLMYRKYCIEKHVVVYKKAVKSCFLLLYRVGGKSVWNFTKKLITSSFRPRLHKEEGAKSG